ncbi:transposase zinc-binding domain-containing protein [Candidatus Pacearchaeota archaeon]|nr:transposase zinc-binding domain-containing protein [Candidatus Pacearchaeota archaeon]
MGAITEIFRTFSNEYIQTFPNLPKFHRKIINAICNCRSGEYGVTVYTCQNCNQRHFVNCSCGNRHCPQCQYHKSRQWLASQLTKQLPSHHFMITFTVPDTIRRFSCAAINDRLTAPSSKRLQMH